MSSRRESSDAISASAPALGVAPCVSAASSGAGAVRYSSAQDWTAARPMRVGTSMPRARRPSSSSSSSSSSYEEAAAAARTNKYTGMTRERARASKTFASTAAALATRNSDESREVAQHVAEAKAASAKARALAKRAAADRMITQAEQEQVMAAERASDMHLDRARAAAQNDARDAAVLEKAASDASDAARRTAEAADWADSAAGQAMRATAV